MAFAVALLCTSLFAAVKPLAIWNGEFVRKNATEIEVARNGVNLVKNSGINCYTKYFVIGSTKGMVVSCDSNVSIANAIIANIDLVKVDQPTDYRVVFDYSIGGVEKYWLQLDSAWNIGAVPPSESISSSAATVNQAVMHSFAMFIPDAGDKSYGILDGVPVYTNTFTATSGEICIGSRCSVSSQAASATNLQKARVSYIAVFPDDAELSLEDFKTWSLYNMTRAETATNVTDAVAAGRLEDSVLKGGNGVGVNLLGGTYRVKDNTKAHALFVQGNSIIEFSGASPSLTLEGPVYISTNCTLTLSLADGVGSASLMASHFADTNQIQTVEGCSISMTANKITVTRNSQQTEIYNFGGETNIVGVAVEDICVKASDADGRVVDIDITEAFKISDDKAGGVNVEFAPDLPTFENVVVDGEDVKPMQFVGDDIVFGVKTMPGLWYASVATNDVTAMSSAVTPMTAPFMATNNGARITAPTFVPPLMFYKIIVAPSRAAFGEE